METNTTGCTTTKTVKINIIDRPIARMGNGPNKACAGTPINFKDSSLNATSWLWVFQDGDSSTNQNPQHTYAKAGVYTFCLYVKGSIAGCDDAVCRSIMISPAAKSNWTVVPIGHKGYQFHALDSSNAPGSYNWNFGDGKSGVGYSPRHTYSADGSYTVNLSVTTSAGCSSLRDSTIVVNSTGITEAGGIQALEVYPNPFSGNCTIRFESSRSANAIISLHDLMGREIWTRTSSIQNGINDIPVNGAGTAGVYYLKVELDGNTVLRKIVELK
jgi:PKD repeat protein